MWEGGGGYLSLEKYKSGYLLGLLYGFFVPVHVE